MEKKMRIKIVEKANEEKVNKECIKLEEKGLVIIDIIYTHESYNHYVNNAVIKYKEVSNEN